MQLGLTWPLQRLLKVSVPYGEPIDRGLCWDAHCITLHGRSSLLMVHCESRYACVRYDLSFMDWKRLEWIVQEEIRKPIDPLELVYPKELPLFDKYDEYLPEELVRKGFAYGVLDLDGMKDTILNW